MVEVKLRNRGQGAVENKGTDRGLSETEHRLEMIIAETEKLRAANRCDRTELSTLSADSIKIANSEKAHCIFGLSLGLIPTTAIFIKLFLIDSTLRFDDLWLLVPISLAILGTSWMGYRLGGLVARWSDKIADEGIGAVVILFPLLGAFWGIAAGAFGGTFMFFFGAFLGAAVGACVGSIAYPAFSFLHQALKSDEGIEMRHLFPISAGISSVIAALLLSW